MIKKLFSLHDEVAARLDQEPNQSALVDVLLAAHYVITLPADGKVSDNRQELAQSLEDVEVAFSEDVPSESTVSVLTDEVHVPVEAVLETPVDLTPIIETVEPSIVEEPTVDPAFEEVVPEAGFEPVEEPISQLIEEDEAQDDPPIEEVTEPVVEEVHVEEAPVDEVPAEEIPVSTAVDIPVNVNGQPGGVCDIHGTYVGSLCIDCL